MNHPAGAPPGSSSPLAESSRLGGERFFLWSMAVLVAMFVAFALAHGWLLFADARDATRMVADRFARMARAELRHQEGVLQLLGRRLLELGALERPIRGKGLVDEMLEQNRAMAGFGLARPDGQLVLVSGVPVDRRLPNLLEQPHSREGFREALGTFRMVVGRTYHFPLLRRWLIPVRLALRDDDGEPIAVMAAGIDIAAPSALWNVMPLDPGVVVSWVRDDGYVQLLLPIRRDRLARIHERPVAWRDGGERDLTGRRAVMHAERLPEYGLTVTASLGYRELARRYLSEMALPAGLFVLAMLLSVGLYRFATRRQARLAQALVHQATHDALTGLPNRLLVDEQLRHEVARTLRQQGRLAVAYVDIDNFKQINDAHGHPEGDRLLRVVGRRLKERLREVDIIGRVGGDEFVIVLPDIGTARHAELLGNRLLAACDEPVRLGEREFFTSISVGMALCPDDGREAGELMSHADAALYRAKDAGRNTLCFYDERFNRENTERIRIANALRQAVIRRELSVVYQPKVRCPDGRWVGAEALLRWDSAELGPVRPEAFIPVAEETGMIETLGRFLARRVMRDLACIHAVDPDFTVALNVSVREFRNPDYGTDLMALLLEAGISPDQIELEVTESIMSEARGREIEQIRRAGLRLAIDDFGTGFSSLSTLKHLPVTTLKIDRVFVRDLETDPADRALVKAMLAVARELELDTVAEGVESAAQAIWLCREGCTLLQGHHFSPPVSLEELLLHLSGR